MKLVCRDGGCGSRMVLGHYTKNNLVFKIQTFSYASAIDRHSAANLEYIVIILNGILPSKLSHIDAAEWMEELLNLLLSTKLLIHQKYRLLEFQGPMGPLF